MIRAPRAGLAGAQLEDGGGAGTGGGPRGISRPAPPRSAASLSSCVLGAPTHPRSGSTRAAHAVASASERALPRSMPCRAGGCHWEMRWFRDEYMTGSASPSERVLSQAAR